MTGVCEAGRDWGHIPIWAGHGRSAFASKLASAFGFVVQYESKSIQLSFLVMALMGHPETHADGFMVTVPVGSAK